MKCSLSFRPPGERQRNGPRVGWSRLLRRWGTEPAVPGVTGERRDAFYSPFARKFARSAQPGGAEGVT
jgi:hypothetical protein